MAVTDLISMCITLVYVHLSALFSLALANNCIQTVYWSRPHDFMYISINNICQGSRYVTTYKVKNITFHVAAILCSSKRYKLLIKDSSDPLGRYRDIGDTYGNGEDHCELVGTDMEYRPHIKLGHQNRGSSKQGIGYYRDGWGEPFKRGRLDIRKIPQWYECGITIPKSGEKNGCKEKKRKVQTVDLVRFVGLSVAKIIGGIIASVIGLIILIFLTFKCLFDGVPYIQSKLCSWCEREPSHLSAPSAVPRASSLRSAMTHVYYPRTSVPSIPTPSSPAPLTPPSPSAPPRAPPWEAPSAPSTPSAPPTWPSAPRDEGAPPTYEEAENYPLVRAAEMAPPSYKDYASSAVQHT